MYEHLIERNFKQVIWNKIYNRNVIENIRFPENRSIMMSIGHTGL